MWQVIINGPGYFDTQYDLPDGVTSLGRADENDIVLSGDSVSRRHARLILKGQNISVEDLGSRNGSQVNGLPLKGSTPLQVGDTVTVGENTLVVRQPAVVERAQTEIVNDGDVGGVHRYAEGVDFSSAVILTRDVNESFILKALDNVEPFAASAEAPFLDRDKTPPPIPYSSLAVLYKTAERLSTAKTLAEFLGTTVDLLMERANGTTAVVLIKQASGDFVPAAVRHRGALAKGEVPVSDAIIDEALKKKAALAVANVKDDIRFAERDSVILYGVDQVLCVPVGPPEGFNGILYVNCSRQDHAPLESLLDLFNAVAHLIGTGVEKFQLKEHVHGEERLRKALERFHAPNIVEQRVKELGQVAGGKLTQMEQRTVTALFADVAGFTALTHKLNPDQLVEILNEFYQRMTGLIFSFEGTVDNFMGDEVMAVFGAPYSKTDDAIRAARAALAMQQEWDKFIRRRPLKERCRLRIGLNTGPALTGTVGSEARLDYTAVGESVNYAAWLCQSAAPGQVLMTGNTLAAVAARFDVAPLGERIVRSDKAKIAVFELLHEDVGANTNPGLS